jgi:hypothetical protein
MKNVSARKRDVVLVSSTAAFLFFSFFSLIFLWRQVVPLTLILFALSFFELYIIGSKKLFIIFILSAIGGAVIEMISIYYGIWAYRVSNLFGIPFWLFPLWGNAGVFIVAFYQLLSRLGWFEKNNS